jgi:hypothetical protein
MLIGSILAELITGRLGDWAVAQPHRSFVGKWVARRNAKSDQSLSEGSAVNERAPEMRLLIGLLGVLLSIVSVAQKLISKFQLP